MDVDGVRPSDEASAALRFRGLALDLDACTLAHESGEAIPLTRGEFALLRAFVTRPGRVLSRDAVQLPGAEQADRGLRNELAQLTPEKRAESLAGAKTDYRAFYGKAQEMYLR